MISLGLLKKYIWQIIPSVYNYLSEYDGVLEQGEEDEEHAGQQPDLQRRYRVRHRDPGPKQDKSIWGSGDPGP